MSAGADDPHVPPHDQAPAPFDPGVESHPPRVKPTIVRAEPIKPLPQTFRVLTYLPQPRRNFYGAQLVYDVARALPEVPFTVVGAGERFGGAHQRTVGIECAHRTVASVEDIESAMLAVHRQVPRMAPGRRGADVVLHPAPFGIPLGYDCSARMNRHTGDSPSLPSHTRRATPTIERPHQRTDTQTGN